MAKVTVKVPKLGLTTETARVTEWSVSVGDAVAVGDIIGALAVDKANYDIEAPASGRIAALLVPADEEAEHEVGTPIAVIET